MEASVNVLMGPVVSSYETEIHNQEHVSWETTCWGCELRVVLSIFAPMFRCGWCGAITMEESEIKPISPWSRRCLKGQHVVVSYGCRWRNLGYISGALPNSNDGVLCTFNHYCYSFFNTLFNFCMAAFTLAGPSPSTEHGKYDLVGRQSLQGYKFCVYCERPKPPNAHHCRCCDSCVVEMDHHCPLIGNCVGSNNLLYFLLFLLFATVSGFYLLGMTLFAGTKEWPNLMTRFRRANVPRLHTAISLNVMTEMLASMFVNFEPVASIRACVLFMSSMGLAIGVGVLLYH